MLQAFFTPGNAGSPRSPPTASSGRSSGDSTGFRQNGRPADRPGRRDRRVGRGRDVGHRRVLHAAADRRLPLRDRRIDGSELLTFPSALVTPHPENNTVRCRYFPAARSPARARPRAAVLVLPQWNADPDGHVGLCRLLAWNGMTALRLSLPYHDQRMPPELHARGLHRQLQRRADGAGQPAGGARRAARDRLARGAGLRPHRHSRHEPRLVSVAADDGARAADSGAGAQSHLAVLRRRRVARPLDAPRARRGSTATSSSICCARCGSRSARGGISSASRDRRTLLVYARYDLTFPLDLSEDLVREFARARHSARGRGAAVRPLHTGKTPFKFWTAGC